MFSLPACSAVILLLSARSALAVPPPCPNSSWVESQYGDCFLPLALTTPVTADQAVQLCAEIEPTAYLPETVDPETNLIVQMVASESGGISQWVWLGLRRASEFDDFAWPSGADVVFEYWASGSPSDWPDNCVYMFGDGTWDNASCDTDTHYVICQMKAQSP